MNKLADEILWILIALVVLILVATGAWIMMNTPDDSDLPLREVDPMEAIIHEQMYHGGGQDRLEGSDMIDRFRRKAPLESED